MDVKRIQNIITTLFLLLGAAIGGYYFGSKGYDVNIKKEVIPIEIKNKEAETPKDVDFARFWEVWDMLNQKHVRKPLDPTKLLDGAIHGMVDAIGDPYTTYLNVEENKESLDSLNGLYEGIGAQLGYDEDKRLIIQTPLANSPAIEAGLMAGDNILAINGEDTAGYTINTAVSKIRGQAGTSVTLNIYRDSFELPKDVVVTRQTIKVDSVTWEDKGDGIALIKLTRFGESTNKEWDKAISEIITQMPNLKGIVLDVRNNPGGYLQSSVYISSEFINTGVSVVREELSDGTSDDYEVERKGKFVEKPVPLVVIINEGSASAAEIVTAALKEKANAQIVGMRSYGKGSVQKAEEFNDGASLHVTIAKWLTPAGNWIDKYNSDFEDSKYNEKDKEGNEIKGGIKPDHVVEFTDEDIKNLKDVQLDKAVEIVKSL